MLNLEDFFYFRTFASSSLVFAFPFISCFTEVFLSKFQMSFFHYITLKDRHFSFSICCIISYKTKNPYIFLLSKAYFFKKSGTRHPPTTILYPLNVLSPGIQLPILTFLLLTVYRKQVKFPCSIFWVCSLESMCYPAISNP